MYVLGARGYWNPSSGWNQSDVSCDHFEMIEEDLAYEFLL